jgi:hypothetical protein
MKTKRLFNQNWQNFPKYTFFKPTLVKKFSRIKAYNALTFPILLYGSEIWTLRKKDKKLLTSIEIKFFRRTAGHTLLEHKRN